MIIRQFIFYLFILLGSFGCGAQIELEENVLAKVDDKIITVDDFIKRAELTPRIRIFSVNGYSGNRALLEMLIGEKLFAIEAIQSGLNLDGEFKRKISIIESQAVLRELYADAVMNLVNIEEEEIHKAFDRLQKTIVIKHFSAETHKDAVSFRELVEDVGSFDAALRKKMGEDYDEKSHIAKLTWGKVNEKLENSIYKLKPNEVSILEVNGGYLVLKIDNIIVNPLRTESQFFQKRSEITKILRMRKADAQSDKFVDDFMKRNGAKIEGRNFGLLVREIEKNVKNISLKQPEIAPIKLMSSLGESELIRQNWNEAVASFKDGVMTIGDVVQKLSDRPNPMDKRSITDVKVTFSNILLEIIRDELLAREGVRRGLHKRKEVRDELRIWRDYFLYNGMINSLDMKAQSSEDIVFSEKLQKLKTQIPVSINMKKLNSIKLTDIPLLAVRSGQSNQLAVPPWPQVF